MEPIDLADKAQTVVELMKQTKERWVAENPEEPDLAIYEHFFRGDDLIAVVQCPMDRDVALRAAQVAAPGFGCSTMTVTFESYSTNLHESPITGKPWMHKEMQFVAQTVPDAFEKDWVHECLTTSAHERGGECMLLSQGYKIKDGELIWLEPRTALPHGESGEKPQGYMFDILQGAMTLKVMEEHLAERAKEDPLAAMANDIFADDPERRTFHIDMATARALSENDLAVDIMLMADEDSNRAEWLEERMGTPGTHITNVEEQ